MPASTWIIVGLAAGVGLVWFCALVLCHRATVVLRWTHKDDEAAERPKGTHHRAS